MRKSGSSRLEKTSVGFKHALAFFAFIFTLSWLALAENAPSVTPQNRLSLTLPVKCEVGKTCLVQKLVDHDASTERLDYRCGKLTTDGHDGVDIRLRTMKDMQVGYDVIAAAGGRVLRIRDGMPDIAPLSNSSLNGKDAGNGVVIDHGNGWETQYSHLRKGSVTVRPGQDVFAGQALGQVGMSGNAEFPHLHFSVRHNGKAIDPYSGATQGGACNVSSSNASLWAPGSDRLLEYNPTVIITTGLASAIPPKSVANRTDGDEILSRNSPLILWVDVIGTKPGDVQEFKISGPDGKPVHTYEVTIADGGLSWFAYSGKKAPATGWLPGRYLGSYIIKRDGKIIVRSEVIQNL
jgi:murein DD-endopeptidase MepM/ murein hydrolase activator NlpD